MSKRDVIHDANRLDCQKHMISRVRAVVASIFLLAVGAGLATHSGWGVYSAFGIDQIALICPVGSLETLVTGHISGWHVLVGLVLAIIATIVFGKAFCAWLCPMPWVQRLLHGKEKQDQKQVAGAQIDARVGNQQKCKKSSESLHTKMKTEDTAVSSVQTSSCMICKSCKSAPPLNPIGGHRDGSFIDSRHVILAGSLITTAIFGFPVFCLVCPVGLSVATFIALWHLFQFNETTLGLLIFPAIVILEVIFLKRWCHVFCPIGALLSLISRANKTFRPQVDAELCMRNDGVNCSACVDVCPERVDPHTLRIPECTKCGRCIEACPRSAIRMAH